jgi:signal transduction histidine kinase
VRGPGADGYLVIQVTDRGRGIAPEHAPRIFERFFTTDSERDGTGLGLAIVQSVALAHRGEVTFRNEAAGGTTFELRLPHRVISRN